MGLLTPEPVHSTECALSGLWELERLCPGTDNSERLGYAGPLSAHDAFCILGDRRPLLLLPLFILKRAHALLVLKF